MLVAGSGLLLVLVLTGGNPPGLVPPVLAALIAPAPIPLLGTITVLGTANTLSESAN